MKAAQIAVGSSYENKNGSTVRTVTAVYFRGIRGFIEYIEDPALRPLYRPLQRVKTIGRTEFTLWAARPARTKKILSDKKFVSLHRGRTVSRVT